MKSHGFIIMTTSYFSPSVLIVKKWERYLGKKKNTKKYSLQFLDSALQEGNK